MPVIPQPDEEMAEIMIVVPLGGSQFDDLSFWTWRFNIPFWRFCRACLGGDERGDTRNDSTD